jgi:hypothetical protein
MMGVEKVKYLSNWVFLLAVAFFLLQSSAIAQYSGNDQDTFKYGSKVWADDPDEGHALSPFYIGPEFAFIDRNDNGIIQPEDPVYIHIDPTVSKVSENDLRITRFDDFPPGSKVEAGDSDYGVEIKKFGTGRYPAAELRYFDVDGDKAYSINDPVYLDLNPGSVSAGDIRITGYPLLTGVNGYLAGTRVSDSEGDSDKPTSTLPGMLSFYNADGNINNGGWAIYSTADVIYIDTQYPFYSITPNDIRMSCMC